MQRSGVFVRGVIIAASALVGLSSVAMAETLPVELEDAEVGAASDPTGLFSDDEVAEGGAAGSATPVPSIRYASFPVDGGEVTLAILQNAWCGMSECPYRFRLETDGGMSLLSHHGPAYGMICQSDEDMSYDPVALTLTACGSEIDLKDAR